MKTVDVSDKFLTLREARAYGRIKIKKETSEKIVKNLLPKGNLVEATKLSGIFGAKKTGDILPFCHPIPFDYVAVEVSVREEYVEVFSVVKGYARTGYEMEALTAVSVALLNVYDMCKGIDDSMVIEEIRLIDKKGGKSDWYSDLSGVKVSVHGENEELVNLVKKHLESLNAKFSETADIYFSVGDNIPIDVRNNEFESVIAFYDFSRNPKEISQEIKVGKTEEALVVVFPENKEKINFFFNTFGGVLKHLLCER